MRIATWNINGGFISKEANLYTDENTGYIGEELCKVRPDIVCLQETHVSESTNQSSMLAKILGDYSHRTEVIGDSHIKDGEKLCISFLSKYKILTSKFHTLLNPNLTFVWNGVPAQSHEKGFLESILDYHGTQIRVLSGHMVPFWRFQKDFMEFHDIRKQIEDIICSSKIPTLLGADMNFDGNFVELLPKVFNTGYQLVLENKPTTPVGQHFDKICISKDWKSSQSHIIQGRADHYMCYADVELLDK